MINLTRFTDLVFHYAETSSTMNDSDRLLNVLNPLPDNFLVMADIQTSGVGRNQNTWISREGGLWFTYCFCVPVVTQQMTLFLGLCLRDALAELFPVLDDKLVIKWPNDILLGNKKLAGILVLTKHNHLMVGTGINTNNDPDSLLTAFPPISLKKTLGFKVSNQAILANFLNHVQTSLKLYNQDHLKPFQDRINSKLFGMGKFITFTTDNGILEGRCKGISEEGTLILESEAGGICRCYSGSITGVKE